MNLYHSHGEKKAKCKQFIGRMKMHTPGIADMGRFSFLNYD
jgi:hypothetical protein